MYISEGVLIAIGFVVFVVSLIKWESAKEDCIKEWREMIRLAGEISAFNHFCEEHRNYSEFRCLKNFMKGERGQMIIEKAKESKAHEIIAEEKKNQIIIHQRAFAYPYEEMIFKLFAPCARYDQSTKEWVVPSENELPKSVIIDAIILELDIHPLYAEKLFEDFVKNQLIDNGYKGNTYNIGLTLTLLADVSSPLDMSFTKWMDKHYPNHYNI